MIYELKYSIGHSDLFVPAIFLIPIQLFVHHITISLDLYLLVLHKVMGVKSIEDVTFSEVLMDPNAIEKGSEASQAILNIMQKYHNSRFCERNNVRKRELCEDACEEVQVVGNIVGHDKWKRLHHGVNAKYSLKKLHTQKKYYSVIHSRSK